MEHDLKQLIENKDCGAIRRLLSSDPGAANEGIPCDEKTKTKAHPLHRICDSVFAGRITDEEAVEIAKILLEFGARIDGDKVTENRDTPLMAAASLHAEQLGIFYIKNGARVDYADRNDGASALHWAAFCGRDKLVDELIRAGANIDQRDTSYNSTPVGWALQRLTTEDKTNTYHQAQCIKLLLKAGADITAFDDQSIQFLKLLAKDDPDLENLLKSQT